MRLLIRADGNAIIGMGHIMRCTAIAESVISRGGSVSFLISHDSNPAIFKELGFSFEQLKDTSGSLGWNAAETIKKYNAFGADCLLLDSYRVDCEQLEKLNDTCRLFYIDDLYAFDYPANNIINHNFGIDPKKYYPSKYKRNLYLGEKYFPVRREITIARTDLLNEKIKTVIVTTGSTDPYNMALAIVKILSEQYLEIKFRIQLGSFYNEGYVRELDEYANSHINVEVMNWTKQIGHLFATSDLIIGPGSTTIIEAMTVGVPSICFSFADNQVDQCKIMQELGLLSYCGDFRYGRDKVLDNISTVFSEAISIEARRKWRKAFGGIFDGLGAERIAQLLFDIDK